MKQTPFAATFALFATLVASAQTFAADWPTYRHDAARSGITAEQPPLPLRQCWAYTPRHGPQPAWPEPGKEPNRLDFDYAFQVAVAQGLVLFGSSADGKVYALDAATGAERWSFFTNAPVRFAPTVYQGRVYVASDDGWLYCLAAADGKLLWKFRGAPRAEMLLGNGRMISRWPLRCGVCIVDGVAYFAAGMWPSEGVIIYALDAERGTVLWKNDSASSMYMKLPHTGAEAIAGVAPQGYILASQDLLFIPTGRSVPAGFSRTTGRLLHYRAAENKFNGGTWATAWGTLVFGQQHVHGPDIDVWLGERAPGRSDGLVAWDGRTGAALLKLNGKHLLVATADTLYTAGADGLSALGVDLRAVAAGGKATPKKKWQAPARRIYSLILAGKLLIAGANGEVFATDAQTGKKLWSAQVPGEARGLAVADGRLFVSLDTGQIICFARQPVAPAAQPSPPKPSPAPAQAALAREIIADCGISQGYCLVAGGNAAQLALALATLEGARLDIYCFVPNAQQAAAARELLDAAGVYGVRATVHEAASASAGSGGGFLSDLPYASFFADLVIVDGAAITNRAAAAEIYRVLRPCGGVAYVVGQGAEQARRLLAQAGVPPAEVNPWRGGIKLVRGPLPGAGDWTHQFADAGRSGCASDKLVRWPLRLLWFGGPGPARMMSRHWKSPAPISTNGRLFILAQNSVIAVNAYNGRELWSVPIPNVGIKFAQASGSNICADSDSVYVSTGSICLQLDARTGRQRRIFRFPVKTEQLSLAQQQTFELQANAQNSGTITLERAQEGLRLTLRTRDAKVTAADGWELFFDFRQEAQRGGLYSAGAAHIVVTPAPGAGKPAAWAPGPAHFPPKYIDRRGHPEAPRIAPPPCPKLTLSGRRVAGGTEVSLLIPWSEVARVAGAVPESFGFAAVLNCSDDGQRVTRRVYKFARPDSYRLTDGWATIYLSRQAAPAGDERLLAPEAVRGRIWGFLAQEGELLFGSVGNTLESSRLFALNKSDGRLRWLYNAEQAIEHNAIAISQGRVFLIDRTSTEAMDRARRRGEKVRFSAKLVALDARTGDKLWETTEEIGPRRNLWCAQGIVLASNADGMSAYAASDGRLLWSRRASAQRYPVIVGKTIYAQPYAYDLLTGAQLTRLHPVLGERVPWSFRRAYGCGYVSAAPSMLFFRSGVVGFYDLLGDSGIHNFAGIRPGCFINIIAAGGLVLIPEASSACTCSYNYQTSVALAPAQKQEDWSVFSRSVDTATGIVRQLAVNFGAPGDRRDAQGKMWFGYPRPSFAYAAPVPLSVAARGNNARVEYYHHNADFLTIKNSRRPWLHASGCETQGTLSLTVRLANPVVALPCAQPPRIDGQMNDKCWDGQQRLVFAAGGDRKQPRASVFLRSAGDTLYACLKREPAKQEGKPLAWTAKTKGGDAPVWRDDSWLLLLSDEQQKTLLCFGISVSGARYDARCIYARDKALSASWNGNWRSAVGRGPDGSWVAELALPLATLRQAGLDSARLTINIVGINRTGVGPDTIVLTYPGLAGWTRCEHLLPLTIGAQANPLPWPYTVILHFAELENVRRGERVFDVKIQGQTVLENFDIVAAAGERACAITKAFRGISAADKITIELVPKRRGGQSGPQLCALEVFAQEGKPAD